jgi:riboflavin synthase
MGHRRQPDEHVGRIVSAGNAGGALELAIDTGGLATGGWHAGDSIYVAGVCLTAARVDAGRFAACVSRETLTCTTLGSLAPGDPVNLEPALAVGDPLGGHYVTGHVDGVARVGGRHEDAGSLRLSLEAPTTLLRYLAVKGSVTLDGVSLTVNELAGDRFGVNLVPHTRAITTPGAVRVGQAVNLEVDILARYLERLLDAQWRR